MPRTGIPIFHAIIEVIVANRAQCKIVKRGQSQALAQIIVEFVQRL